MKLKSKGTLPLLALLIPLLLQGGSSFAGGSIISSSSSCTADRKLEMSAQGSYWDQPQHAVPDSFLRAIREEPWRGTFEPCVDHPLTEIEVEGKIPQDLQGTLFRNGPGRNREGERAFGHWFDGDGHIAKVVFKDGRVYAQNRFVATDAWDPSAPEGERSAGAKKPWTPAPGGWWKNFMKPMSKTLNTSVMIKGGRLYALSEGSKPEEMDPVTLETLGESDLGGIQAFYSAHPTVDPVTGETFNIGIGGAKGSLELTRLSPDGTLEKRASFVPPAALFWHDNTLTKDYVVAVTSPFVAPLKSLLGAFLGFGQIGNAFKWDGNMKSEAFFFSRDTLELVKRVELPGSPSSYHIVNGFQERGERGTTTVVIAKHRDGGREKLEKSFRDMMHNRLSDDIQCDVYKYEIDVAAGVVVSHGPAAAVEGALPMELPTVDMRYVARPNRYVYTNSLLGDAGFVNSVQRGDLQGANGASWTTHDFGESRYGGEPIFVPKSEDAAEGEGYLIVLVYNTRTHTTDVEVLDAQKVDAPPFCVAHVPWHMGTSFHGIFTPKAYI